MMNGSFTLADSDSDTGTNSMKFYCQWVPVSGVTSNTSHLLLSLSVGLRLGQCKHTRRGLDLAISYRSKLPHLYLNSKGRQVACVNSSHFLCNSDLPIMTGTSTRWAFPFCHVFIGISGRTNPGTQRKKRTTSGG